MDLLLQELHLFLVLARLALALLLGLLAEMLQRAARVGVLAFDRRAVLDSASSCSCRSLARCSACARTRDLVRCICANSSARAFSPTVSRRD